MNPIRHIWRSTNTLVFTEQFLFSGTNFVMLLLLARILSPPIFGIYSTITLLILLAIGISNSIVIQPYQVSPSKFRQPAYDHFIFIFQLLVIALLILIGLILKVCLSYDNYYFKETSFLATVIILHDFFRKYFLAKKNLSIALKVGIVLSLMQLIGLLYLKQAHINHLGNVLYVLALCYVPAIIYSILKLNLSFYKNRLWRIFLYYHLKEGRWLGLVSFLQWSSGNLLVLSLALFINAEALGAFRLVQSLFGILNILFQTFENYVLPNASRLYAVSVTRSKEYLRRTSLHSSILISFILVILFIYSGQIMKFAGGNKYEDYEYIVRGMCFLYFILFIGYPVRLSIRMLVLNKLFFLGYLLSFLSSVLFFNFLLKHWQLHGVIIGLVLNQLIMLTFWNYQLNKKGFYLWK